MKKLSSWLDGKIVSKSSYEGGVCEGVFQQGVTLSISITLLPLFWIANGIFVDVVVGFDDR